MAITMRGTCSACKRRRLVRRDGLVRKHYKWEPIDARGLDLYGQGPLCAGSDLLPLELDVDPENNWHCNTGCSGCRDMINYGV